MLAHDSPTAPKGRVFRPRRAEPCAARHGENGISDKETMPSLAGSPTTSSSDFRSGARSGGGAMPEAVAPLSDDDLVALAHFLAHLK
jgi:cytochrome c553